MSDKIALALSGAGVRAIAFHAGVLRGLAQQNLLESVVSLSTVSGGSLFAGLVFAKCSMRWPTSAEYADVHRAIRVALTETDLLKSSAARSLLPSNWRFASSKPNIIARVIYRRWRIRCALGQLPDTPQWLINCVAAEDGKALLVRDGQLINSAVGAADMRKFSMASAMAFATAMPVGHGPFCLDPARLQWRTVDAPQASQSGAPYAIRHLYDGSVHDSTGIEALFDAETGQPRGPYRIIVSDAASACNGRYSLTARGARQAATLMETMMDQNRALRVRGFMGYLRTSGKGSYISLQRTQRTRDAIARAGNADAWLGDSAAAQVHAFPASLHALTLEQFDLIERHGYESAILGLDSQRQPAAAPILLDKREAERYCYTLEAMFDTARDVAFDSTREAPRDAAQDPTFARTAH